MGHQEHIGKTKKTESEPMAIPAKSPLLHRATQQAEPDAELPIVHEGLNSPGQPLDGETRAFMEPRFGHDFSQVRLHTDTTAQARAAAEGALAYTADRDVVFGAGQYQPHTIAGRWLIGHELTHVIQQRGAAPENGAAVEGAPEMEARDAAVRVALGGNARVSTAQAVPAVQFLRVSDGGFGRALEKFTNDYRVENRAINLLKNSTSFMNLVNKTLDKHYVSPFDVSGLDVIPSADPRPADKSKGFLGPDGRLLQPAAVAGKRPLYFHVSDPSFEPFKASGNNLNGDIINLIITDTPTFIQGIAHEATHAANFVGGVTPKAQTLVAEIEAGIKDEIAARTSEAKILGGIPDAGVKAKVAEVGSRDPREVQRDVSPAFNLTYLEMFFFARELRDAKASEKLDDEQAAQMRSRIDQYTGSYAGGLSENSWAHSKYGRTWFDRKTAMHDWVQFRKNHSWQGKTSAARKENLLQDHAKWFFHGKVSYLP